MMITDLQTAKAAFVEFVGLITPKQQSKNVNYRYVSFYGALVDFYKRFSSEKRRNIHIGALHFKINLIFEVMRQMITDWRSDQMDLGIKCPSIFERNVNFLFDIVAGEAVNIRVANEVAAYYPSGMIIKETIELLNDKNRFMGASLNMIEEVTPTPPFGLSCSVFQGAWMLVAAVGEPGMLFGTSGFREIRLVMFYSKLSGPTRNHIWDLTGHITFHFGTNCIKALTYENASDEEFQNMLDWELAAKKSSELMPEPFISSPQKRFTASYSEDVRATRISRYGGMKN